MRARVLSAMMCKGGVGKTTFTLVVSEFLSRQRKKVLVIDTDPQGNLTLSAIAGNLDRIHDKTPVVMDVLSGLCEWSDAVIPIRNQLDLIPSTALNSLLDRKLLSMPSPLFKLRNSLSSLLNNYDFIIFDSAPNLNLFNASLIVASDEILLPINLDEYSKTGLDQTLSEIADLKSRLGLAVEPRIIVNKYSPTAQSHYYLGLLAEKYRSRMFQSMIRSTRQAQVLQAGLVTDLWSQRSHLREDFARLVHEILNEPRNPHAEI